MAKFLLSERKTRKLTKKKTTKVISKKETKEKREQRLWAQKKALQLAQVGKLSQSHAVGLGRIIKGRGDYELGKSVGAKAGAWIGGKLHQWFSTLFGSGDYDVVAPSAGEVKSNSLIAGSNVPSFSTSGGSGDVTRISFHEFIGNVKMTAAFNCTTYDVDITDPRTFPWASRLARNYQQWRLVGCVFFLRSLSSDAVIAPTAGMGSVAGALRYDVHSDPPTSKSEVLNSMFASSAKPSQNQALPMECAKNMTIISPLKVLPAGASRTDLQFYQMAKLDIVTEGAPNDYEDAMELHVAYEVEFLKPCLSRGIGQSFMLDITAPGGAGFISAPLTAIPDTPGIKQPRINTIGCTIEADKSWLDFPVNIESGSTWLVSWVVGNNSLLPDFPILSMAGSGGMIATPFLFNQANYEASCPVYAINTGCAYSTVTTLYVYDGSGTSVYPPRLKFQVTGATVLTQPLGGTVLITQFDPVAGNGVTSRECEKYTRGEFIRYLSDVISKRKPTCVPPIGLGRVADWTHQFSKTEDWPVDRKLPVSPSPFDQTFMDALAYMMQYTPFVDDLKVPAAEDRHVCETEFEQVLVPSRPPALTRSSLR